eukprot:scaffold9100_cov116-Cylindrotheca_fusiformis.AAC.1
MIDFLQHHSAQAATNILNLMCNTDIKEIKGENVLSAVSLIRGGLKRLRNHKDPHTKASIIPHDFNRTLVQKVFQSTSVKQFNEIFADMEKEELTKWHTKGGKGGFPPPDEILTIAENVYTEYILSRKVDWKCPNGDPKSGETICRNRKKRRMRRKCP